MKKRSLILSFLLACLFMSCQETTNEQFLHVDGTAIVDGNGEEFIIRSMGLGGWMLQEGYMMKTAGYASTQHQFKELLEASMGEEETARFYKEWLGNHCTKADIDSLSAWGFNAVRPALHYNLFTLPIEQEPVAGQDTWLEEGFLMVDNLLEWCKENNMYVILDLHAAPGGQGKDAAISDYDASKPSLWESEENKRKTIALWRKLAERYADEKYIGGYDLINETNWNFNGTSPNGTDSSNEELRALMVDITKAIREVDKNHMVFIEGNGWANNFKGMLPPWDDNMVLSFHKYWNGTSAGSIHQFLEYREKYNIPIWLGESGENSNEWFYETIAMLEENKVGWSWWTMKKIGSATCLTGVEQPAEYDTLLAMWAKHEVPSADLCRTAMFKMTENLRIQNCAIHYDVIDAMFRQVKEDTPKPYKAHQVPGVINAVDYDMGRYGVSYNDADYINTTGKAINKTWNRGRAYRNGGVDIKRSDDSSALSNGYNVAWTNKGEWMLYTINVETSGNYKVSARVKGSSGSLALETNGEMQTQEIEVPNSSNWLDLDLGTIQLDKGKQELKFYVLEGGFELEYLQLKK